jgi:hypothetical protein
VSSVAVWQYSAMAEHQQNLGTGADNTASLCKERLYSILSHAHSSCLCVTVCQVTRMWVWTSLGASVVCLSSALVRPWRLHSGSAARESRSARSWCTGACVCMLCACVGCEGGSTLLLACISETVCDASVSMSEQGRGVDDDQEPVCICACLHNCCMLACVH